MYPEVLSRTVNRVTEKPDGANGRGVAETVSVEGANTSRNQLDV